MTCVVGFTDKENKVTWMGADSMGSNGYTHGIYDDKKVFHNETISNIITFMRFIWRLCWIKA